MFAVAALPDGRIVSASQDKTLRIWDLNTGACDVVLKGHKEVSYLYTHAHTYTIYVLNSRPLCSGCPL